MQKNSNQNLICICHHVLLSFLWLLHFYRYFSPQAACSERAQIEYAPDWVMLSLLNIHLCFHVCVNILFGFFHSLHLNNDENSSVVPFLQYPMMYIVSADSWLSLCIRRRGVLSGCTVQSGCDSLSLALPSTWTPCLFWSLAFKKSFPYFYCYITKKHLEQMWSVLILCLHDVA